MGTLSTTPKERVCPACGLKDNLSSKAFKKHVRACQVIEGKRAKEDSHAKEAL